MTMQIFAKRIDGQVFFSISEDKIKNIGLDFDEKTNVATMEVENKNDELIFRRASERRNLIKKFTREIFDEHREMFEILAEGAK